MADGNGLQVNGGEKKVNEKNENKGIITAITLFVLWITESLKMLSFLYCSFFVVVAEW